MLSSLSPCILHSRNQEFTPHTALFCNIAVQSGHKLDDSDTQALFQITLQFLSFRNILITLVREELIEYYRLLSETAAARERKALWRIRRHQLSETREQWLNDREREIQESLKEQQDIGVVVNNDTQSSRENFANIHRAIYRMNPVALFNN